MRNPLRHSILPALPAGLLLLVAGLAAGCGSGADDPAARAALKKQLSQGVRLFRRPTVDEDDIQPLARRFYRERDYRPAWVDARGPSDDARELVAALENADRDGLDPRRYAIERIRAAIDDVDPGWTGPAPGASERAALDLLLTRSFLRFAAHLATGQVDPKRLPADWHLPERDADLLGALEQALAGHEVRKTLEDLPPDDPGYRRLRDALAEQRTLVERGGWRPIPPGPPLRRGARGPRVAALSARLVASGELGGTAKPVFDAGLESALRRFQLRHGLEDDGVLGADDRAALNVPAERRLRQIELNMERRRWLELPLGDRYLEVNIPDFTLRAFRDGRTALAMRVVVGGEYSRTPLFSDAITYLVLNPSWNVPQSIATEEILAKVCEDEEYLARQNIAVFEGQGEEAEEVDAASIDWNDVEAEGFPYRFRQRPGPGNPLGRIKFMCPNQFDVYLHDTPADHLFDAAERDFSHGCVRLERPFELAELLLRDRSGSDAEALEATAASARDSVVRLSDPVPVHLLYWTAWVDEDGRLQFRDDLYGYDRVLERALARGRHPARSKPASTAVRQAPAPSRSPNPEG